MTIHLSEDQEIRELQLKVLSLGKSVATSDDETYQTAQTIFSGAMEPRD